MEKIAFRLNPTQGLAGMDKTTRVGIRPQTLMAERAARAFATKPGWPYRMTRPP